MAKNWKREIEKITGYVALDRDPDSYWFQDPHGELVWVVPKYDFHKIVEHAAQRRVRKRRRAKPSGTSRS